MFVAEPKSNPLVVSGINEPLNVWFPLNKFEPVVAKNELLTYCEAVNEFNEVLVELPPPPNDEVDTKVDILPAPPTQVYPVAKDAVNVAFVEKLWDVITTKEVTPPIIFTDDEVACTV